MENEAGQSGIWTGATGSDAPKVDEVLAKKSAERDADAFLPDQKEQIAALKSEIERLRDSIQQIASGTTQIASAEFKELSAVAEEKLKQNVSVSVGIAAFIGYLWGRSGR